MWCLILNQLTNAVDQANISKSCMLFRDVMMKKRVNFLFSNVLNIILSVKKETCEGSNNNVTLSSRVKQTEVMNCRLVCSSWNMNVENLYEKPAFAGIFPFVDEQNICPGFFNPNEWSNPYIFTASQPFRAQLFVSNYIEGEGVAHKNPFLGRFVVLHIGSHNRINLNIFSNAVTTILETFGGEIWYAMIYIRYSRFSTATEDYLKLRELLTYMPNLKSIRLYFHSYCTIAPEIIGNCPLPDLNNLIHLGVSNVGVIVLNELFRKYSHVSYLQINKCGPVREWSYNAFTNLKGLLLDAHCQVCSDEAMHWFGNNVNLGMLFVYNRKLELRFCKQFEIIKRYWCNSLKALTLKIEGYGFEKLRCPRNLHLKLLQLNRITIHSYRNLSLDFVQTLKNLLILDVSIYTYNSEIDESSRIYKEKLITDQKIEFAGFETRMQVSNIWSILKKLEKLVIKITHRQPIVCYEYVRNHSGIVTSKKYLIDSVPKIQVPHTYEYVFENLEF